MWFLAEMHHLDVVLVDLDAFVLLQYAVEPAVIHASIVFDHRLSIIGLVRLRLQFEPVQAVSFWLSIHNRHDFLQHLTILNVDVPLHFLVILHIASEVWVGLGRCLIDVTPHVHESIG